MWQVVGRSRQNDGFMIGGLRVWQHDWEELSDASASVWDPVYRRAVEIRAYRMSGKERDVVFGAAELTPGSWLFCQRTLPGC